MRSRLADPSKEAAVADKTEKAEEPRPRSGQITFVTGVHYHKGKKKLYITKRKLTFKNGVLVGVGGTGPAEELQIGDGPQKPKKSK
jgi:hypothetical protein